jgi:RNA polymerase sigma-70 factor (ECF subfamily)
MTSTSPLARFDALFTAHQRAVLAYAMRRTSNLADAEDVTAETFTIAWRKLESIPADPLPWLYAVARRVLANHRRGVGRRERLAAVFKTQDVPTPMRVGEDVDGPAFRAMATLSVADQEVLRLVAWEGLKNPQIAEVLGISVNAVAIRLHRARSRFEAALAKIDDDDLKSSGTTRTQTEVTGTQGADRMKGVPP